MINGEIVALTKTAGRIGRTSEIYPGTRDLRAGAGNDACSQPMRRLPRGGAQAELLAEASDYLDDEVSRQNRITIFVCECDNRDSHVYDDEFPE